MNAANIRFLQHVRESLAQLTDRDAGIDIDFTVSERGGILAGKAVTRIAAGGNHCFALCADGTLVAWGYNLYGQLGNNSTTHSTTPVLAITTALRSGEKIVSVQSGSYLGEEDIVRFDDVYKRGSVEC